MTDKTKHAKTELTVMGEDVEVDHGESAVGDIDTDMDAVASQMSYYGDLWSQAEEELLNADAHYRAWKAQLGEQLLSKDPKLAEWKVRQKIEASKKFLVIKERLAKAKRNATVLRAHFESLKSKASILQSKGAMRRAEFEATSMTTRSKADDAVRKAREEKMRSTFKSKGKRG